MNGTSDNGFRNNLSLSRAAREIPGLRHLDLDLYQLCSRCRQPEVMIEATSSAVKQTQGTRIVGTHCGVPTILLRHAYDDKNLEHEVSVYWWEPGRVGRFDKPDRELVNVSWKKFQDLLRWVHRQHTCKGQT